VTTNYDFVLESMLTDRGLQLGPGDLLSAPRGVIPIFHVHGHRLDPNSIVITQEDYTSLQRPGQYRQFRLPVQFMESTVVCLGYGIGDPNVLVALDWSKNVITPQKTKAPCAFIQAHRVISPSPAVETDRNGCMVVEIDEIEFFLKEVATKLVDIRKSAEAHAKRRAELHAALKAPKAETVALFVDNQDFRAAFIQRLRNSDLITVSGAIQFLSSCIDLTWQRSTPKNAFHAYNQQLTIICDFLEGIPCGEMHPSLMDFLVTSLDHVARYVGNGYGQSWQAATTWEARRAKIPAATLDELRKQGSLSHRLWISSLVKTS
jgi:hypothetical protein